MSDYSSKAIVIDADLYAKIQALADGDRFQVSKIISDALNLFTSLSLFARMQIRQITVEQPAELPWVYRAVSATVTHAVLTVTSDPVWTPKL